jgi:hypothetical protein
MPDPLKPSGTFASTTKPPQATTGKRTAELAPSPPPEEGAEDEQEKQSRESESAFDRALGRMPPG